MINAVLKRIKLLLTPGKIENPIRRDELIEHLSILADLDYQLKIWGEETYPQHGHIFDYAMHFLLDDTVLAENPSAHIGDMIKNEREAKLVGDVTRPLLRLFEEIGGTHQPYVYIEHPTWLEVVEAAKRAHSVLKRE